MTYSGERGQRLVEDINKAGFYPQLVIDVVQDSLDGRSFYAAKSAEWRGRRIVAGGAGLPPERSS